VQWRSELSHFQLMTVRPTRPRTLCVAGVRRRVWSQCTIKDPLIAAVVEPRSDSESSSVATVSATSQSRSLQSESDSSLQKHSPPSPHSLFYSVKRAWPVNSTSLRGCYPPDRNRQPTQVSADVANDRSATTWMPSSHRPHTWNAPAVIEWSPYGKTTQQYWSDQPSCPTDGRTTVRSNTSELKVFIDLLPKAQRLAGGCTRKIRTCAI
jgi:hypothetical protein